MDWIDLHVHSSASDGDLSPREVVRFAKSKGLRALALTDHDTVDGLGDALEEGGAVGLEVIPGVELSAWWPNGSMHLLGYYVRPSDKKLQETLNRLQLMRVRRNQKILERLDTCGVSMCEGHLLAISGEGQLGRPHIARAMIEKGYVDSIGEAFQRYLKKGAQAYVEKERLRPDEIIPLIKEAGGIPVLAHPRSLGLKDALELEACLLKWIDLGLMGIEGYYPGQARDGSLIRYLGEKHGLIITGGTDYHGANKPGIEIGIGRGDLRIPYEILKRLRGKRQGEFLLDNLEVKR